MCESALGTNAQKGQSRVPTLSWRTYTVGTTVSLALSTLVLCTPANQDKWMPMKSDCLLQAGVYIVLAANHTRTPAYTPAIIYCKELINHLTPNDSYRGRTAPLTSKRCILYIYSTNIGTEYFKHGIYSLFFFLFKMQFHNSHVFVSCIIHILYTGCAKIKKKIPAPKD